MINHFFGGVGGVGNLFDGAFVRAPRAPPRATRGTGINTRSAAQRQRRAANLPYGLFGAFDFPSIFNDDRFGVFGSTFHNAFDPGMFMNNFYGNFRSSRAFEDFLNRTAQMHEPAFTPAAKEAVEKLPIIVVEEKHCKKKEDSEELEPPSCPVCIDEISVGNEAMFMPCGHTFHPDCLRPWLEKHNTCPICRKELPTEE